MITKPPYERLEKVPELLSWYMCSLLLLFIINVIMEKVLFFSNKMKKQTKIELSPLSFEN